MEKTKDELAKEAQQTVHAKLSRIQFALKAPKSAEGRFGKHRNVESILEALKPILHEEGCALTLDNQAIEVNGRIYQQATARLYSGDKFVEVSAQAWEGELSRGLDAPQVTGSASSYARKYALGGLFAIDDSKDPDSHKDDPAPPAKAADPLPAKPTPPKEPKPGDPVTAMQKNQLRNMMAALEMDNEAMGLLVELTLDKPNVDTYGDFVKVKEAIEAQ
jgi:hypothetical protein